MSIKSDKENNNPNKKHKYRNSVREYENSQRGRDFAKPKVSKLKQPGTYNSQSNSRDSSRSASRGATRSSSKETTS